MNWPLWRYSLRHPLFAFRCWRRRKAERRFNALCHAIEAYRVRDLSGASFQFRAMRKEWPDEV